MPSSVRARLLRAQRIRGSASKNRVTPSLHFGSIKSIIMPGARAGNKKRATAVIRTGHLSKEFDTVVAGGFY